MLARPRMHAAAWAPWMVLWAAACPPSSPPQPPPPPAAAPAPTPPPPPAPDVTPGVALGPLRLGAPPPPGHDGERRGPGGGRTLYWSEEGLEATLDPAGVVIEAAGHSPTGDPYFRAAWPGRTEGGLAIGAKAADVTAALGPGRPADLPSPFASGARRVAWPDRGVSVDLSGAGEVIAIRVAAPAP